MVAKNIKKRPATGAHTKPSLKKPAASKRVSKRPAASNAQIRRRCKSQDHLPQEFEFMDTSCDESERGEDPPESELAKALTANISVLQNGVQVKCTSIGGIPITECTLPLAASLLDLEDFIRSTKLYGKTVMVWLTFFSDSGDEVAKVGLVREHARLTFKADIASGIRFVGRDSWSCAAGGGDEEIKLQIHLDHGAFPVPALLKLQARQQCKDFPKRHFAHGEPGKVYQSQSAEVRSESVTSALQLIEDRTNIDNHHLDPHNRYEDCLDLDMALPSLEEMKCNFSGQGRSSVNIVKSCMGYGSGGESEFKVVVQERHFEKRHGHIWGEERPDEELDMLDEQQEIDVLKAKWCGPYNSSAYDKRDEVVLYFGKKKSTLASVRVRISARVHRDCCCLNPFEGIIEL